MINLLKVDFAEARWYQVNFLWKKLGDKLLTCYLLTCCEASRSLSPFVDQISEIVMIASLTCPINLGGPITFMVGLQKVSYLMHICLWPLPCLLLAILIHMIWRQKWSQVAIWVKFQKEN
ncbi:hypothetical protein ACS0TY_032956 [Phlomoides rotata]